jgi:hypothetical protein
MTVITQALTSSYFLTISLEHNFGDLYLAALGISAILIFGADIIQELFL